MSQQLAKHWITADEYEQMGRAGIFHPDARLELLDGEIYEMSPIGSPHAACVKYLSALLNRHFNEKMIVSTQDPIRLNDFSEPQPDIALLRWRDDFTAMHIQHHRTCCSSSKSQIRRLKVIARTRCRSTRKPASQKRGSSTCLTKKSNFTPNLPTAHISSPEISNGAKKCRRMALPTCTLMSPIFWDER